MSAVTHVKSITVADGTNSDIVRPSDWLSAHAQLATLAGNTAGVSTLSGTNFVFAGSNNVTVSGVQGANAATIGWNAPAGGGGSLNVSAGTTSNNLTNITFADGSGVSWGLNASTLTATVRTNYASSSHSHGASANNGSFAFDTLSFSNANGVSFGTSAGSAITASVAAQTNQTGGIYITAQSTGQSSSSTYDVRTLSMVGDGIVSIGWSNSTLRISATQSNQAFSAGAASSTFQTLSFQDSNGLSFSNNAGAIRVSYTVPTVTNSSMTVSDAATSGTLARLAFTNLNGVTLSLSSGAGGSHTIVGSHNAITTARASTDAIGLNTAQSNVTWTVNSAGLSFDARGYAGTGTTFAGGGVSGSMTVNSVGVNLSLSANAGTVNQTGPNIGVSTGGNTLGSTGTVSTGNVVFVGGANITLSQSTAAAGSHATITIIGGAGGGGGIGAGVSTGGNTAGSTGTVTTGNVIFVGSNGITLSQSTGAAGSAATVTFAGWPFASRFWNGFPNSGAFTRQDNSSVSLLPFFVAFPYVASNLRMGLSHAVGTAANASTAYADLSLSGVLYSRNGSTLSSILSASSSYTKTWSSNATGAVAAVQKISFTHAAATMTPGEYWWAIHVSTTNTATGGANTTALGNSLTMVVVDGAASANFQHAIWGSVGNATYGAAVGLGCLATNATRATIAFSDYTQTGSRAAAANIWFDHGNVTFY